MKWKKKGLIFNSDGKKWWSVSHAQLPVAELIDDKIIRIYYSTRDKNNISRPSYIEVEAQNPANVTYIHDRPILDIGAIGTFDDCGVIASSIASFGGKKYLYYVGWTVRNTVPYHNSIGLAMSDDGGRNFHKFSAGPIFSPTYIEPYFTGTSEILIENNIFKNWYLSCTGWKVIDGKPEPLYNIKYAESTDGINWQRNGVVAINYKNDSEGAIVRASVIKEGGIYKMWYAYRNFFDYRNNAANSYKIGYGESDDGIAWTRIDNGISLLGDADSKWDNIMNCYPCVIKYKNIKYMFYNGNNFGET